MLLSADDKVGLRAWIMKKLPEVSDSETEIFADYLLALLASGYEYDEEELRALCEQELPQFLNDGVSRSTGVSSAGPPLLPVLPLSPARLRLMSRRWGKWET
ncbi:hypothetical protein HYQ44_003045 [Verticillium longisporum]|nr:hypothetical protein HYQ44_003045 [Verticillium longisporum]